MCNFAPKLQSFDDEFNAQSNMPCYLEIMSRCLVFLKCVVCGNDYSKLVQYINRKVADIQKRLRMIYNCTTAFLLINFLIFLVLYIIILQFIGHSFLGYR